MTFKQRLISGIAASSLTLTAANLSFAAPVPPQTAEVLTYSAWTPTGWAILNAGAASSNVALGSLQTAQNQAFTAWVYNTSATSAVNVLVGTDNTISVSLSSGTIIPPMSCVSLNANQGTFIAGIAASGTATLDVMTGYGVPGGSCAGGTGSGGGATANVTVTNFPSTQPISAASLPLPAGAATSALQTTGNTSLATLVTNTAVTAAGTSAAAAQPVQGVTGGVPLTVSSQLSATWTQTTPTCPTAAASIMSADATRVYRGVVNASGSTVYLGPSASVTTATGTPLFNGQTWDFSKFSGALYCVAASAVSVSVNQY
jgi:hypothetical protein